MDPIGFGLESFDAIGRYREHETILIESETGKRSADKKIDLPLDTNGEVRGIPDSTFSDSVKLGQILSQSTGMPAVHGAPALPLCVWPHGDIRGRRRHQPVVRVLPGFRIPLQRPVDRPDPDAAVFGWVGS